MADIHHVMRESERKRERETERDTERWTTKEHGTISTPFLKAHQLQVLNAKRGK